MICLFWPRSGKQHFLWGGVEFLLALSLTKKLALLLFPCLLIWLNSKCFSYLLNDDDDIMSFCVCCIILHLRYVLLIVSSRTIQSLASMPSSQTRQNWSQTKKWCGIIKKTFKFFIKLIYQLMPVGYKKNTKCFLVKGKYDQGTMLGGNNNLSAHRS